MKPGVALDAPSVAGAAAAGFDTPGSVSASVPSAIFVARNSFCDAASASFGGAG
jgi:hypothetical protein